MALCRFCLFLLGGETRKIKCGADERRRRGLDRADPLSAPAGADVNESRHILQNAIGLFFVYRTSVFSRMELKYYLEQATPELEYQLRVCFRLKLLFFQCFVDSLFILLHQQKADKINYKIN